jgi:cytochrome c-type biogenesis protein CcmE
VALNPRPSMLSSRRARLILLLAVATAAISLLAFKAASSSVSYYVTPEEFAQQVGSKAAARWRVGGRVVGETIKQDGKSVEFDIQGEHGEQMAISYTGVVPNLFGPSAFVVVDGTTDRPGASGRLLRRDQARERVHVGDARTRIDLLGHPQGHGQPDPHTGRPVA